MPRFQFRLKSLLSLREAARDERRAQLAEAYAAQRKLDERRQALEQDLEEHKQMCRAGILPGRIDVDRLLTANRYELVLRAELGVVAKHEQTLAVEIERRRQALVVADRDVRVLEKLRERELERFRREQARQETKQMDEIASRALPAEERW
jgi:flagellar FliJ protein